MRFVPYRDVSSVPNVIVDGAATQNTVLTLSHWPKSGTPAQLKGDTSAAIVFNYLDSPRFHVEADAVSNNHFDEDGLVGIFSLIDPSTATRHRALLLDTAQAGDFGVYADRRAARIAFTLAAYANAETSPLPGRIFQLPYPEIASGLYGRTARAPAAAAHEPERIPGVVGRRGSTSSPRARISSSAESSLSRSGRSSIWLWFASRTISPASECIDSLNPGSWSVIPSRSTTGHAAAGCSCSTALGLNFSTATKAGFRWRHEDRRCASTCRCSRTS